MEQLSLSQQYANRGIYLLCKVLILASVHTVLILASVHTTRRVACTPGAESSAQRRAGVQPTSPSAMLTVQSTSYRVLMVQVVGDMMKGPTAGGPRASSAAELDNYIRHPPTIGGRVVPVGSLRGMCLVCPVFCIGGADHGHTAQLVCCKLPALLTAEMLQQNGHAVLL